MINRDKCEDLIIKTAEGNATNRTFRRILRQIMREEHGVMDGRTLTLLNGQKSTLQSATVEELYWLCSAIESATDRGISFEAYYTPSEVSMYKQSRQKRDDVSLYPVVFDNVLQLSDDQWVTTVNVDELFDLYKKQLINYNKNTQRPTRRKEKNGLVEYKISVSKKSIREITELMQAHLFIPNALTFNINLDNPQNNFTYSGNQLRLLDGVFDIIDGFHRYKSLIDCKMADPLFNYNMVLNIVNFTEEKAGTYIAQEDKRNKISKRVVKTMDANNPVNRIISRLNDDGGSCLRGQIGRTGEYPVNSAWLYEAISKCYKVTDRREEIALLKYLKQAYNAVDEEGLLEKSFFGIAMVVIASKAVENQDVDKIVSIVRNAKYVPEEVRKDTTVTKAFTDIVATLKNWG